MRKFIRNILLFVSPIFLLLVAYIYTDVFRVIHHYDPFYDDTNFVWSNRSYGSVMTYINQQPKYHYDSFIFGNSRSLYYEVDEWKKHLPAGSSCIHMDESVGSVSGVRDKIRYIDKSGGELKNALLVIDWQLLNLTECPESHITITPPILKDNDNLLMFHLKHFLAFLNPQFLLAVTDYSLFRTFRPYMSSMILDRIIPYDTKYNEFSYPMLEESIQKGTYYDDELVRYFSRKQWPGTYSHEQLSEQSIVYLKEIKEIFDKHQTSYKIVISPLYDQRKLRRETYRTLCGIFGKDHIYDFSGVNAWTSDYHNYYEPSHYRPKVSAEIMNRIY